MPRRSSLPPGPRAPVALQTLAMLTRQRPFLERARRRYGRAFTMRVIGLGDLVVVSDPELVKQVFRAPADVLHAGSPSPLRRLLGPNSLLGIDEDHHLRQRRLLLPPFKGERMRAYEATIAEIAAAEIDGWPEREPFATAASMQRISLRAIARAVFGAEGARLRRLEQLIPPWTELGSHLATRRWLQRDLGPGSPWRRFTGLRVEIDVVLDELIAMARTDPALGERADVLALLVQARHDDGAPMTNPEIRDQLVTMLGAGHETTAHTLCWAVERLARHPAVLRRLVDEVDAGTSSAYREATIREVQRVRPVVAFAGRGVVRPFELAGHALPVGTRILLAGSLTHYDPALFPRPDRFEPERFVDTRPDTYAWIPFGGGIRRCLGSSFAHMEMDVVLRTLLERVTLEPTGAPDEPWAFRGVAWAPGRGGEAVVRRRVREPRPEPAIAA